MAPLIPASSACHSLTPPPAEKDERLNLNVRTGSTSCLVKSIIFVHGGLTIGIELYNLTIPEIESILSSKLISSNFQNYDSYLSSEFFYLNIIERVWNRVHIDAMAPKPSPRLFHDIKASKNRVYLFGGLVLDETEDNRLRPINDLWEFDIEKKKWTLLDDGKSPNSPLSRFNHRICFLNDLSVIDRPDHTGIMILGGKDESSQQIFSNSLFDLTEMKYFDLNEKDLELYETVSGEKKQLGVDFKSNMVIPFETDFDDNSTQPDTLVVYSPNPKQCPMLSFDLTKGTSGRRFALKNDTSCPHTLRYPTGGRFGQNIVIVGFLPNDYDIAIFIYHIPTAKWSRLNIFCHHEYGAHRFWGGFVWGSHHKVVLVGNYVTSRTSSAIRYFTQMITVSLPVTNVLAAFEDQSAASQPTLKKLTKKTTDASFSDYAHYAAPKNKFSSIRSVFPPAAVTLGRNAFERYGYLISDFEFVSADGDRTAVPLLLLRRRWGRVFDMNLAKGYIRAVEQLENENKFFDPTIPPASESKEGKEKTAEDPKSRDHGTSAPVIPTPPKSIALSQVTQPKKTTKEVPQFRLPFQEKEDSAPPEDANGTFKRERKSSSVSSSSMSTLNSSDNSLNQSLFNLPPQLPLPLEPIPPIPEAVAPQPPQQPKHRSSGRGSLSMTPLNNLKMTSPHSKSPNDSPITSPRGSVSGPVPINPRFKDFKTTPLSKISSSATKAPGQSGEESSLNPLRRTSTSSSLADMEDSTEALEDKRFEHGPSYSSSKRFSLSQPIQPHIFQKPILDLDNYNKDFKMESLLIPRKLYFPFSTSTVRAFIEFLYTGQVGTKWTIAPTALDVLLMSKFYEVPLLYDLILEVLYGIIGKKEDQVIRDFNKMKDTLVRELDAAGVTHTFEKTEEEFLAFVENVEDGYLDTELLRRTSRLYRSGTGSGSSATSKRKSSVKHMKRQDEIIREEQPTQATESKEKEKEAGFDTTKPSSSATGSGTDHHNAESPSGSESDSGIALAGFVTSDMPVKEEKDASPLPGSLDLKDLDDSATSLKDTASTYRDSAMSYRESAASYQESSIASGREKESNVPTLEQLASPSGQASDMIIDFIYETAVLATDMKLMLRAINVREMSKIYKKEKFKLGQELKRMRFREGVVEDSEDEEGHEPPNEAVDTPILEDNVLDQDDMQDADVEKAESGDEADEQDVSDGEQEQTGNQEETSSNTFAKPPALDHIHSSTSIASAGSYGDRDTSIGRPKNLVQETDHEHDLKKPSSFVFDDNSSVYSGISSQPISKVSSRKEEITSKMGEMSKVSPRPESSEDSKNIVSKKKNQSLHHLPLGLFGHRKETKSALAEVIHDSTSGNLSRVGSDSSSIGSKTKKKFGARFG